MLGWLILLCVVIVMYKVAEIEGRNGVLWGGGSVVICLISIKFIPLPFINLLIGLVLSYGAMFMLKMFEK